jgi:hypothetical protein
LEEYASNSHKEEQLKNVLVVTKKDGSKKTYRQVFQQNGRWWGNVKRNARKGYSISCNEYAGDIITIERDPKAGRHEGFKTLAEFMVMFNPRFITLEKISELWHNGIDGAKTTEIKRSKFKKIGKEGKTLMKRFLEKFDSVNRITEHYMVSPHGEYKVLMEKRYSSSSSMRIGRDIGVEHSEGNGMVFWSSEYPGCGNGSYYIVANERTILHLEDD